MDRRRKERGRTPPLLAYTLSSHPSVRPPKSSRKSEQGQAEPSWCRRTAAAKLKQEQQQQSGQFAAPPTEFEAQDNHCCFGPARLSAPPAAVDPRHHRRPLSHVQHPAQRYQIRGASSQPVADET